MPLCIGMLDPVESGTADESLQDGSPHTLDRLDIRAITQPNISAFRSSLGSCQSSREQVHSRNLLLERSRHRGFRAGRQDSRNSTLRLGKHDS